MAEAGLHIAVDGRELLGQPTGVGRYVREILKVWSAAGLPHRIKVFLHDEPEPGLRSALPGILWHVERSRRGGTRWEQTQLPRSLARARPDVFYAPAYTAPLRLPCPFVVVVHDVSFFAHPEWFPGREGWRRRWLTRVTARRARTVITVSEFARSEIGRYLRVKTDRILLASPAAPPPVTSHAPREPLVLYVGSLFNRRRVADLIKAFGLVARRVAAARLILVGDNRTSPPLDPRQLAAEAGLGDRFEWRDYVDDSTRDDLYERARVFAFLSDYEGFGMPPLEALAHGLPSVVLDTAVSREVYGDAALRVQAEIGAIADGLVQLLTDDALRSRLVEAGAARLRRYSWTRTADTTLRALEAAAR
jgi:glycosyltransferase involved in cell wall biosynthesis